MGASGLLPYRVSIRHRAHILTILAGPRGYPLKQARGLWDIREDPYLSRSTATYRDTGALPPPPHRPLQPLLHLLPREGILPGRPAGPDMDLDWTLPAELQVDLDRLYAFWP